MLGPPAQPVANADADMGVAQLPQAYFGRRRKLLDDLDAPDLIPRPLSFDL